MNFNANPKRLLSVLLAVLMVVSMLPVSAFAAKGAKEPSASVFAGKVWGSPDKKGTLIKPTDNSDVELNAVVPPITASPNAGGEYNDVYYDELSVVSNTYYVGEKVDLFASVGYVDVGEVFLNKSDNADELGFHYTNGDLQKLTFDGYDYIGLVLTDMYVERPGKVDLEITHEYGYYDYYGYYHVENACFVYHFEFVEPVLSYEDNISVEVNDSAPMDIVVGANIREMGSQPGKNVSIVTQTASDKPEVATATPAQLTPLNDGTTELSFNVEGKRAGSADVTVSYRMTLYTGTTLFGTDNYVPFTTTETFHVTVTGPVTYTLTYDANAGTDTVTGMPTPNTHTEEVDSYSFTVPNATPERNGYTFKGWAETANATTPGYKAGDPVPVTKDAPSKTIYAVWEKNTYTVTFDANGGTPAPMDQKVKYGELATMPQAPTRDGYVFDGWYNGDVKYNFSTPVKNNLTLTAKWLQEYTYTLTYDANAGTDTITSMPDPITVSVNDTADRYVFTVSDATPARVGYIFKGWADTADATIAGYSAGNPVTVTNDAPSKTIYAVWEKHEPHTWGNWTTTKEATCVEPGEKYHICSVCNAKETVEIEATGHTEVVVPGKAPTCTETGLTEGKKCSVCNAVIQAQVELPAKGHTEETIPAVEATCTETGLTEGKKCSVCGTITQAQEVVSAKGHTEETIPAVEATCTTTGLTEGKKCSVCGTITQAQEVVPVKGHTEETIPAVEATCTETGLTEGKHCSVCNAILVAQEQIPATGHAWNEGNVTTEPTCGKTGEMTFTCTTCGTTKTETITATGHTLTHVEEKKATCTEAGNVEYWYCSVCGKFFSDGACTTEISEDATKIPATGEHNIAWTDNGDGTHTSTCSVCGQKTAPEEHTWNEDVCTKCGATKTHVSYTVTYTDGVENEVVFENQVYTVEAGAATPIFTPDATRDGYTFAGWDPAVDATVTESVTYTAKWTENEPDPIDPTPGDKVSEPGMDKAVVGNADVKPSDTVSYTLKSTVPEKLKNSVSYSAGTASDYILTFHDDMADALTLNTESIKVTVGERTIDSNYTVTTTTTDGCTFEVAVDLAELYNAGVITETDMGVTPIEVSYTATLSEDAAPGAYRNDAKVTWPNNGESSIDTENVYTYGIQVFKFNSSDRTGLAGAAFQLTDADSNVVATGTTDENGNLTFNGLKEGTYYLTETQAPAGYLSSTEPIPVHVNKTEAGEDYIVGVESGSTPIPQTGGNGTDLYTFGGMAILCMACVVFVISRKKTKTVW